MIIIAIITSLKLIRYSSEVEKLFVVYTKIAPIFAQSLIVSLSFLHVNRTICQEQKRKLFHSQIYENEIQLKKLYIQTCKRLPAYGCQMFQVKEILKGKTSRRRVTRLLGLGLEHIVLLDSKTLTPAKCQLTRDLQEWRISGGNNHDRIILEFRATKWLVAATSQGSLHAIGNTLWGIMQDIDSHFLTDLLLLPSKEGKYMA